MVNLRSSPAKKESQAGHAPHTASPDLLKTIKRATAAAGTPFSIHLAESEEETTFISTGKGDWADFLSGRGIAFDNWPVGGKSPVQYADALGLLDRQTLAVHLIQIDSTDIEVLSERGVHACCCPRSNLNLHGRLPSLEIMIRSGINVCIGTDSLASVESLGVLEELTVVAERFKTLSPRDVFDMGTRNGSLALGVADKFGTLEPGKDCPLLYLSVNAASKRQLLEKIVHGEIGDTRKLIW